MQSLLDKSFTVPDEDVVTMASVKCRLVKAARQQREVLPRLHQAFHVPRRGA